MDGGYPMRFQRAYNNIECKLINNVGRVLVFQEEWESIKAELQRLRRIEDSVKMGVSYEEKTKS